MLWSRLRANQSLCKILGLEFGDSVKLKDVLVQFKEISAGRKDLRWIMYPFAGSKSDLNNRSLNSLTIGDFKNADKDRRSAVLRLIQFAASGSVDSNSKGAGRSVMGQGNDASGGASLDIGKLTFSTARTVDILKLIPIGDVSGRFGALKAEIWRKINELEASQSAIIKAPKRKMDFKEAKAVIKSVTKMFTEQKKPWVLIFNPMECLFILIRKADLEKVPKGA